MSSRPRGVGIFLDAGNDAGLVPRHRNCHYQRTGPVVTSGYCTFPGRLPAGSARRLADDVRVVTGRRLLYGTVTATAWPLGGPGPFDDFRPADYAVRGSGPPVRLAPATGLRFGAGGGFLRLASTGRADLAVRAGAVRGRTGDVVRLEVEVRNRGPADIDLSGREGAPYRLTFRPPAGTTVLRNPFPGEEDPWTCSPARRGARLYRCPAYGETLAAGDTETFVFDLRLDRVVGGATGTATLEPNLAPWPSRDADRADDVATVATRVTAAPVGGAPTWPWIAGVSAAVLLAGVAAPAVRARRRRRAASSG